MCGISGAIDVIADRAAARVSMVNDAQAHRGPDHCVVVRVGGFTLGNTRLAIQDPGPGGNQPFVSADGRYHCVFNGEIYNHRRLAERFGLQMRTACDGEIIPQLWAKVGPAALAELRGMFAIALVDSLEERLYLARDPFGIKPLYWRMVPEGLVFASEVRPLAKLAGGARIDPCAIARYLRLGAVAADKAPFLGIMALRPNNVATFDREGRRTVRPIRPDGLFSAPREPQALGSALADSVELHLGADVPTALLLSSGVDSAAIAAVSRRFGRDLDCLTVAAEGIADESHGAAETARHYGHHFRRIHARLNYIDLWKFFGAMQRPSIDGLNTYVVCKAVHEAGFKVALSGLGGDEAVGGYPHFRLLKYLPILRTLDKLPRWVSAAPASALAKLGLASEEKVKRLLRSDGPRDGWGLSLLQRELFPEALVRDLTGVRCPDTDLQPTLQAANPSGLFASMTGAEVELYLQATLLPDSDGFSMASSVELRVPFVDSHVFSASMELASRTGALPGKQAIGTALGDPYLIKLAAQPKHGFSLPMRNWMSGPLAPVLRAVDEPDAPVWSVIDRERAQGAGLSSPGPCDRWAEAWAIAALNAWLTSVADESSNEARVDGN